jgi:protein-disulfide isomerase
MAYLAAATALVGLLATVNLLLTVGVVRRLREHTAELAGLRSGAVVGGGDIIAPPGSPVGELAASDVDGHPVTLATVGDRPLVGFFSPHCEPCRERLPEFVAHAAQRPGGVLAVVVAGSPGEAAEAVDQLRPVATVVVEPDQGPVQKAFGVTGFPAFALVEDGVVAASHYDLKPVADRDGVAVAG